MRTTRIGLVCGLLACGSLSSWARAQETPPVLDQTATVHKCEKGKICLGENKDHVHKAVQESSLNDKQKFVIRRKFPGRSLRHIDVLDDWFDELQRPGLHLIHPGMSPLSVETFQFSDSTCASGKWNECLKFRDFPLAFGIYNLENPLKPGETKPTKSLHAFVYIPMRFNEVGENGALAGKGNYFVLMILHIPDKAKDCESLETRLEQLHCGLTVRLRDAWKSKEYSRARLRLLVASEYRWLLDHLLEDFAGPFDVQKTNSKNVRVATTKDVQSIAFDPDILSKVVIFLHNDIIHGDLE